MMIYHKYIVVLARVACRIRKDMIASVFCTLRGTAPRSEEKWSIFHGAQSIVRIKIALFGRVWMPEPFCG